MPYNPPLHSFLPSIISLLSRVSLLLSRPASFNQYSSRTNANKHLRIHHHLRVLVSRGLYKALLYFTLLYCCILCVVLCITVLCCANNQMQIFSSKFNLIFKKTYKFISCKLLYVYSSVVGFSMSACSVRLM